MKLMTRAKNQEKAKQKKRTMMVPCHSPEQLRYFKYFEFSEFFEDRNLGSIS